MIRARPRRAMNQINVVPYIDVMLVLLVIFMVTAPFINPSQVALPSVGKSERSPADPVEVVITQDGGLKLRDKSMGGLDESITEAELADAIRRHQPADVEARPVVISADKSVRYEAVMKVMDNLQRLGIPRVGLLVQPAKR